MPPMRLALGQGVLLVNPDSITPDQMDSLSDQLGEVTRKHSIFGKYPLKDGETIDEWRERVEKEIPEKNKKKDEESAEDYLKRIFKPQRDKHELIFDVLMSFCSVFGGSMTREGFRSSPYGESKSFVLKVLKGIDFPTAEYE